MIMFDKTNIEVIWNTKLNIIIDSNNINKCV